ncbi:MAG: DUF389 domain-containing protein [Actinomycetota bacterium]|nr:DUF389 domain-containing protein [Actinomycetota bacterium]
MTLHVRVVSPAGLTEDLVSALTGQAGVANLVVLAGSARPGGDAVQFDVSPQSANSVLRQLRDLQVDRLGSIVIAGVDAALGPAGRPAAGHRVIQRDAAPLWDVVEARVRSDAVYAPSFYLLLLLAGLIAAVDILTNSQILIVGAMVVGPEYNAIISVALGIEKREPAEVRRGCLALLAGFCAAIVVALIFGLSAAYASWSQAGGSAVQLVLNVVLLIVVGAGALRAQRMIWRSARLSAE